MAWGDSILAGLPARARAFFGAGRFVEVSNGKAVFALPNAPHAERCESRRGDVEQALADHFGRPVPLRLTVDDDPPRPEESPAGGAAGGAAGSPDRGAVGGTARSSQAEADEDVDLTQLTDANDVATSSVDRVRELFPGAELVDEA